MKFLSILSLSFVALLGLSNQVEAQKIPVLEFYHGAECPHCHDEKKWLPTLQEMYPDLDIQEYEIWHNPENQKKAVARIESLGGKLSGVPTNIVGDQIIVGFDKNKILTVLADKFGPPQKIINTKDTSSKNNTNQSSIIVFFNSYWKLILIALIVIAIVGFIFGSKKK